MQEIITHGLMTFGAGFTTAAITKAKGPGRALDDIMTLVGFERLHEVAEQKRVKRDLNIKKYKESIAQKVASTPEEKLQEPPLSIVGPALEASKYYIEEENLREMFSSLIAASMNSEKNDSVHPSYVDVIKQLSPHDATILSNIRAVKLSVNSLYPIMKMTITNNDKSYKNIFPLITLFKGDSSFLENAPSINNLERLGIIKTTFETQLKNDKEYDIIRDHNQVKSVLKHNPEMELVKGVFVLTNYGQNFINICVGNNF